MTTTTDDPLAAAQRALSALGERFNKLAVECERLTKLVAANQEAADVLRLAHKLEALAFKNLPWCFSLKDGTKFHSQSRDLAFAIREVADHCCITLPAKDEQPGMGYPELKRELDKLGVYIGEIIHTDRLWCGSVDGTSIITNSAEEYLAAARKCVAKTAPAPVTSPSPDVASGAEGGVKYEVKHSYTASYVIRYPGDVCVAQFHGYEVDKADEYCAYLNGTSPVHQQLAEAREEIENLVIALNESNDTIERYTKRLVECDRGREAWDAVRKYYLGIDRAWINNGWQASVPNIPDGVTFGRKCADPIEAVLELAKTLEKGG